MLKTAVAAAILLALPGCSPVVSVAAGPNLNDSLTGRGALISMSIQQDFWEVWHCKYEHLSHPAYTGRDEGKVDFVGCGLSFRFNAD